MSKILFILFVNVLLPMTRTARCAYGCSCYDDSTCDYYCTNNMCENLKSLGQKCSGYYIHPRECGPASYCDTNSDYTCQSRKSYGEYCTYGYSCASDNCDYTANICQSKRVNLLYVIVIPSVTVFVIVLIIVISVAICRRRVRRLTLDQAHYVFLLPGTSRSSV